VGRVPSTLCGSIHHFVGCRVAVFLAVVLCSVRRPWFSLRCCEALSGEGKGGCNTDSLPVGGLASRVRLFFRFQKISFLSVVLLLPPAEPHSMRFCLVCFTSERRRPPPLRKYLVFARVCRDMPSTMSSANFMLGH